MDDDDELQKSVNARCEDIEKLWGEVGLCEYLHNAIDRSKSNGVDENEKGQIDVIKEWVPRALNDIRDEQNVEAVVQCFLLDHHCGTNNEDGDKGSLWYYLRSSPNSVFHRIHNVPQYQLAMCSAYREIILPNASIPSIIYDDEVSRHLKVSDGVVYLLAKIIFGNVKDIIIRNANRLTSNEVLWILFLEVCYRRGVDIHLADSIGKDIMSVVCSEGDRIELLNETNTTLNEAMDKLREPLIAQGKKKLLDKLSDHWRFKITGDDEHDSAIDSDDDDDDYDKKPAAKVRRG